MASNEIGHRAIAIAMEIDGDAGRYMAQGRAADAKRSLADGQRKLRQLKSEAAAEERELRAHFEQMRLDASKRGERAGILLSSSYRAAMARGRATAKRSIAQQRQDAVAPYRRTKWLIDQLVAAMATARSEIRWRTRSERPVGDADQQPFDAALRAVLYEYAPATLPPPVWASDPFRRSEYRWWDGTRWTEHVRNGDQSSFDPL
jgi:hypothetical protein